MTNDKLQQQKKEHQALMRNATIKKVDQHLREAQKLLNKLGSFDKRYGGCIFGSLYMNGKDGVTATQYSMYINADTDLVKSIISGAQQTVDDALQPKK